MSRHVGLLFAVGALAMVAGLAIHPAESYDAAEQMPIVAANEGAWRAAHATLAVFPIAFAIAAIVLGSRSDRSRVAWALVACGGLVGAAGFIVEATATPTVAAAGDLAAFRAWSSLSAGLLVALAALALGLAAFAAGEAAAARGRAAKGVGYVVAALTLVGTVGIVGDSLKIAALGQLLPATFAGVLYATVWGVRASISQGSGKEVHAPETAEPAR